jgi:glucosamine kinase
MSRLEHKNHSLLLIEAGSTKTLLYYRQGNDKQQYIDVGYNPLQHSYEHLDAILCKINYLKPLNIEFYGAGCVDTYICQKITNTVLSIWPGADVFVGSDLLAAAKACFGNSAGIVAILGTGSASGFFDGNIFTNRISSGGYLLGDAGSGFELGKSIVYSWLLGDLQHEIASKLEQYCGMNAIDFRKKVYSASSPVSRVADLAKFAAIHRSHSQISTLITQNFNSFINRILLKYLNAKQTPIGFCGGIAYYFKDELLNCLNSYEIKDIRIIRQAGDQLIDTQFDRLFN